MNTTANDKQGAPRRPAVLLSSGGMDSFLVGRRLPPGSVHVFVDVQQKYRAKEHAAAARVADECTAQFVPMDGAHIGAYEHPSGIIPFRNAELLLCAAQHGDHLYMGVLLGEINSDKSPEFLEAMERVLNISHRAQYWTEGRAFQIHTPLRGQTKSEAVRVYLHDERRPNLRALLATVSCYSASEGHCGRCPSCFKRWVALTNNGVTDPSFDDDPARWRTAAEWSAKLREYNPARRYEVMSALQAAGIVV